MRALRSTSLIRRETRDRFPLLRDANDANERARKEKNRPRAARAARMAVVKTQMQLSTQLEVKSNSSETRLTLESQSSHTKVTAYA